MPSVDNRVVRMEFDNAAFEARIKQTLSSLAQLDKALKLDGAHKGLSDISAAAGRVNFAPLQTAVQSVSAGFLALSTIAITALSTITSRAITAGASMVKSLSMEPILEGFREYELNMGSIQTILANTKADGTALNDVNAALDQLNEYSDKTIYNFGQMARNIGTFTAAGVDLQTSVQSIKGISNLAAISGSSAEQASTAMYQLSQAVSTGTLRLMDWNSVVNAGMGGEVFQKALFTTGQAMGTIANAPMGTTFEEWTSAGNSFRDSLQDGWLTAEVLTTTLAGFTGEMTEAQLLAIGYTKEQAAEIIALGQTGVEAATKVRTLTGLMSTLKEGIASGWAQSFRIILGDFEEATQLFTGLSNSIGGFFKNQAEARNAVLQGWADLGGREQLLQGLENAFAAIGKVLSEVGKAFRDVFPAATAQSLFNLTVRFKEFTAALKPSEQTIENVRRIFTGLFSALDIGWEILKAGVGFIKDLIIQLTGLGSGNYLEGAADILDFFTQLREKLGDGVKIQEFFDNLAKAAQKPIEFLKSLKDAIFDFFGSFGDTASAAGDAGVDRISERFEHLSGVFERLGSLGGTLKAALQGIMTVLDTVGEAIVGWFQELGDKLSEAMDPGEFDAILDALNVSLLGGIGLLIANFLRGGINFDVGNGFFSNISEAFGQLTGTLEAMQTSIRADALLKIAAAVGILAAAMVALSLIDSAALTRALVAMAVGFGQLMASFAILNAMSLGITSGVTFAAIAAGMILLASAIVILSGAVAILGDLSWGELTKGLLGVMILLAALTASAIILSKNAGPIALASVGLIGMSLAISILAGAVALFGQMDWGTMIKGFAGVALGLLLMAGAAHLMPPDLALKAVGLVLIAGAMNLLAVALKSMAELSWGEMVKGFVGIAGSLILIGAAMHLFPPHMLAMAAGLLVVGVALNVIARALGSFGDMSWSEIGKGLVVLAGSLLILAVAANAMAGALPGAAAILVMSVAVSVLAKVLIELGKVPFGDLLKAIGAMALALAALGLTAFLLQPLIPAILALGAAMLLVGAAFALFGIGALAVAKAFEILAEAGPAAAGAITAALEAIGGAIPALMAGFAQGILDIIQIFADAAGPIAEAIGVLLVHLLETIQEILPLVAAIFLDLILLILEVITTAYPQIVQAGIGMILALLQGLSENIQPIVEAGLNLLTNFLNGIAQGMPQLAAAVLNIVLSFIATLQSLMLMIISAGVNLLVNFLLGITMNMQKVIDAVGTMILTFIGAVANLAVSIAAAGTQALVDFLSGMTNNLFKIVDAVTTMITTFINAVSNSAQRIITAGADAIIEFVNGLGQHVGRIVTAGVNVVLRFLDGVADNTLRLANAAAQILIDFLNGLADAIRTQGPALRAAGGNIASAIIDGITGGISSGGGRVKNVLIGLAQGGLGSFAGALGIRSPSKEFYKLGQFSVEGFALGLEKYAHVTRAAEELGESTIDTLRDTLSKVTDELSNVDEFVSPVITPVIDLTPAREAIAEFQGDWENPRAWVPSDGFSTAQAIAQSPNNSVNNARLAQAGERGSVTFEQNIFAPTELSTADIYKQTRNQITLAKEELDVP